MFWVVYKYIIFIAREVNKFIIEFQSCLETVQHSYFLNLLKAFVLNLILMK